MAEPAPVEDLIVIHANEGTSDMGRPAWVTSGAIYRLADVATWTEQQEIWDVVRTNSIEIGTLYGNLPTFKLILK